MRFFIGGNPHRYMKDGKCDVQAMIADKAMLVDTGDFEAPTPVEALAATASVAAGTALVSTACVSAPVSGPIAAIGGAAAALGIVTASPKK